MEEEFEICLANNVIPIPVGATGYISKALWEKVVKELDEFFPKNSEIHSAINELGKEDATIDEIITNVIKVISMLQKS